MTRAQCIAILTFLPAITLAGSSFAQSDYYIRSQYPDGTFTGSHEILIRPKEGYYQAQYCDRMFWVSTTTVVWTEEEVAAGRTLILEENFGEERNVLCSDNTAFASLYDLGLDKREIEALREPEGSFQTRASRIHTIRDAFKQFK
ncbi:hypothetical protein [Roseibium alexandrii]|uniref:Uncharacterized protein n=1 Tax=Roseibium alexandrii TaxID=388408 RepID=A0A0M6ZQ68_9HYPH|nr:hypothetical protein [Roseibium alexandrii]CTQ64260.1 hypothetical protein LAX5112_00235 [Roseibium alexandrii]